MNNTLNNGFRLLEFLADSAETYSVKELAQKFDMPNSHICRLLKTLVETGYVEQDSSRKYRISLRILCLSNACLSRLTVRNKVRPYLDHLLKQVNKEVYLAVPLQGRALIVDVLYAGGHSPDYGMTIGRINNLHTTACGKLCAAYQSEEVIEELLRTANLEAFTSHTITDSAQLKQELARVRSCGYAATDSERSEGTFAVAAPVFNAMGELAAALGSFFVRTDATQEEKNEFIAMVKDAAQSASFAMGFVQ